MLNSINEGLENVSYEKMELSGRPYWRDAAAQREALGHVRAGEHLDRGGDARRRGGRRSALDTHRRRDNGLRLGPPRAPRAVREDALVSHALHDGTGG